jgi:hypothetical protein
MQSAANMMDRDYLPQRIQVRPGLTALPQTLCNDFKLSPSSYGLEIRLSQHRIRSRLIPTVPPEQSSEEAKLWTALAYVMAICVGGVVVVTQSIGFGIVVAVFLPLAMWIVTTAGQVKKAHEVTLRMVNAPDGQTFLSASSGIQPARNDRRKGKAKSENLLAKNKLHFNHFPIHLVSAKTTVTGGQVCFVLHNTAQHCREEICIKGSRREARWLHARIAKWGRGTATAAPQSAPQVLAQRLSEDSSEQLAL